MDRRNCFRNKTTSNVNPDGKRIYKVGLTLIFAEVGRRMVHIMFVGLLLALVGGNTTILLDQETIAKTENKNNNVSYYSSHGSSEIELQQQSTNFHSAQNRHNHATGFSPTLRLFDATVERVVVAIVPGIEPAPSKRYLSQLYPSHNFW